MKGFGRVPKSPFPVQLAVKGPEAKRKGQELQINQTHLSFGGSPNLVDLKKGLLVNRTVYGFFC